MEIIDKRRILISWRPENIARGDTVLTTKEWVSILDQKLRHARNDAAKRSIEVAVRGKPGDRAAEHRDVGSYTDFVAVLSDDYCDACDEEARQDLGTELLDAMKRVQDWTFGSNAGQAGASLGSDTLGLWTTPISKGRFWQAQVGGHAPWSVGPWHHLKDEGESFTIAKTNAVYDEEIARHAAEPIIQHVGCGASCTQWLRGGSVARDAGCQSRPSFIKRVFAAFVR